MCGTQEFKMGTDDFCGVTGTVIRPSGCAVFFCEQGFAVISANFKKLVLRRGDVAVVFPDTMFVVDSVSRTFKARRIEVSPDVFDESTFSLSSGFFDRVYDNPVFNTTGEQREILEAWHRLNEYYMRIGHKQARMMLRNQMYNLFAAMEAELLPELSRNEIKTVSPIRGIFNRFCQLLVENCYTRHDVKFYADKLCITPYYLSKITFRFLEMSPKQLIDRMIVMEMKRLLVSTDLSSKEIADMFNFDDTSYMGRYFRRHTGMSPAEFRGK